MCSSLKLFGFSPIKSLMMVNCLSFYCFYFRLQLLTTSLFFLFLILWPLKNTGCLISILCKLCLFLLLVFISLTVFHLKLWNIVSCFVLMILQIQFNYWTISYWKSFSFLCSVKRCGTIKWNLWFLITITKF